MITTLNTPRINTNDDRVEIVEWHVEDNSYVDIGQPVVDIETSKAVITVEAEASGYVAQLLPKGTVARVGTPYACIASTLDELQRAAAESTTRSPFAPVGVPSTPIPERSIGGNRAVTRFSREAERLLQEKGLARENFAGAGLVTRHDVEARLRGAFRPSPPRGRPPAAAAANLLPPAPTARDEQASLAKLAEIQSLTTGECGNINSRLSIHFDSAPIRVRLVRDQVFDGNIQPLIIYEISRLLRQWPQLTAYFDDERIHYYDRVDVGVAVDLGRGLKVVTLRDTDTLMPIDIFEKTLDIGMRYIENRIRSEELTGATFTITDLSGFDILHFHPLINGRQSAIVGLGGDSSKPGHPMSINLTFDHRVTNGREAGSFLKELRERLIGYALPENPTVTETAPPSALPIATTVSAPESVAAGNSAIRVSYCDICGIEREQYYREYGKWAFMLAYVREDGTVGGACHRCVNGNV